MIIFYPLAAVTFLSALFLAIDTLRLYKNWQNERSL